MGMDLALQRVQAYRVFDDQTVVTVSQLFPVADVEEFTVSLQRQQLQAAEERRRTTRERSTVQRLVAAQSISDGTLLTLRPTTEVTSEVRAAIDQWIDQDPRRGRSETGYRVGSDRGSPNHGSTVFSKRVMAQIWSPVRVRTYRPTPWRTPVGVRR
jgi:hypothetical protein